MHYISLTILWVCLLAVPSMAQKRTPLLNWEANKPLKWENFKGRPDASDVVHAAVTYAGIALTIEKYNPAKGTTTFGARAVFDQQQSWVHPTGKDEGVLAHEQLHFDITEVYARKLQKKLNSLNLNKKRDKEQIIELQEFYNQQQLATQARFDKETLHGLHADKEKMWRNKIQQELKNTGHKLIIMPQDKHYPQASNRSFTKINRTPPVTLQRMAGKEAGKL